MWLMTEQITAPIFYFLACGLFISLFFFYLGYTITHKIKASNRNLKLNTRYRNIIEFQCFGRDYVVLQDISQNGKSQNIRLYDASHLRTISAGIESKIPCFPEQFVILKTLREERERDQKKRKSFIITIPRIK